MLGHAISSALARAKIQGGEVEDVVMGCAMQQARPESVSRVGLYFGRAFQ